MPTFAPYAGVLLVIVVIVLSGIRIAQEYQRAVVFRLGRFIGIKGPGIYYLIPLIDRQQKVDIRTATVNLEQQETITKDSVTIKVNAVLWFRIVEASKVDSRSRQLRAGRLSIFGHRPAKHHRPALARRGV